MKIKLLVSSIALIAAQQAAAELSYSAGLTLGQAKQEMNVGGPSISGDDIAYAIRAGVGVTENIAFELSYNDYGSSDDRVFGDDTTLETTSINLGVKASAPISDALSLVTRFGVAMWDNDLDISGGPSFSDDGSDMFYAFGVDYALSDSMEVGLEYSDFNTEVSLDGFKTALDVETISVSLGYTF